MIRLSGVFDKHFDLSMNREGLKMIESLKHHFNFSTEAEVIKTALRLLKLAATIEDTDGELIAKKGSRETRINISSKKHGK